MIHHLSSRAFSTLRGYSFSLASATSVAVLALILVSGCAQSGASRQDTERSDVLASYRGGEITLTEFRDRFSRSTPTPGVDSAAAYQDFLERYINFKLKVMDARRLGLGKDSSLVEELATYRNQLARPYLIEREIMDSLATALYARQMEEVLASHILKLVDPFDSPEDTLAAYRAMEALVDSLAAGADFNALAVRHSDDPTAGQNQGRLGYFSGGRLIYEFEDMAYNTPVGEVSPIFRTMFGYHLLKVEDRKPAFAQLKASHILVSTRERDSTEALQMITSLKERIAAGEDFAVLARQYSEDPGSAARGGDLGFFGRGRMVAPFEEAAYSLQEIGQVSDVVRTQFGYHLLQLTDRQVLPPYGEAYESLKTQITRMPRYEASERLVGARYRRAMGSTLDQTALTEVLDGIGPADSTFLNLVQQRLPDTALDRKIGSVGSRSLTVRDFAEYLRTRRFRKLPNQIANFVSLGEDFLNVQALDAAAETLESRNPEFARLMSEYEEGILLFAVSEDSVWTPASTDTTELAALYERNRGQFRFPERLRIVVFQTRVDSVARSIAGDLDAKIPLSELLANEQYSDLRVDTTFVADSTNSVYDRAFGLEVGEHTEPVRGRQGLTIVYLDGREAPREKTFEEARADLVTLYQDILEERWISRLRSRYGLKVYPERLQAPFAESLPREAFR